MAEIPPCPAMPAQRAGMRSDTRLRLLSDQPIFLSASTMKVVSDAERAFARVDGYISASPYRSATRSFFVNIETASTAIIEDASFDIYDLLDTEDIGGAKGAKSAKGAKDAKAKGGMSYRQALYRKMIETGNSWHEMKAFSFDAASLSKLGSPFYSEHAGKDLRRARVELGKSARFEEPQESLRYIEDLCMFCNKQGYSPIVQAAVASQRINELSLLDSKTDGLARNASYVIYAQRHFANSMIVPLAMARLYRRDHLDRLPSYPPSDSIATSYFAQRPIENGIAQAAVGVLEAAGHILRIEQSLHNIEASWRYHLPGLRRGDACDIILSDLITHPVIDTAYACSLCGKSFSTINDSVRKLEEYKILQPVTPQKRNRKFVASDVMDLYASLLDQLLPAGWTPGMPVFGEKPSLSSNA